MVPPSNSTSVRTDSEIMLEVINKLHQDWRSSISNLSVGVKDGVVKLKGISKWPENKERAIEIARQVRGVREVIAGIEVIG